MGYKNWKIVSYNVTSLWASKCFLIKPHGHQKAALRYFGSPQWTDIDTFLLL